MKISFTLRKIMAILLSLALILVGFIPLGITAYAATVSFDGYIKNGDFEAGATSDWHMGGTSSIVSGGHDDSSLCLRLSGGKWTNIYQDVQVEPNTEYRVSGWVKREKGTGAHYLFAKCGNDSCQPINDSQQYFTYTNETWVQHIWEFNSASATSIQIVMCIEDEESVFLFDDIILEKISDVEQGKIANGDFETGNSKGWISGSATMSSDAHGGNWAMQLTGVAGVGFKQIVEVKGLTDYKLKLHVKRNGRGSGAHVVVIRNGDKVIPLKDSDGIIKDTSKQWVEYEFEFNSGLSSRISIIIQVADKGSTFMYDDISLEEIKEPDYSDTLKGDVTLDGVIDDEDLILLNQCVTGQTALEGAAFYAADLDGNGEVVESDADLLGKFLEFGSASAISIYPIRGETVAKGSWQVEAMLTDYTPFMTDDYSVVSHRKDQYMRDPVVLKWMYSGKNSCAVLLADNEELTGAKTYTVTGNELSIQNLLVDTDYYWAVEVDGVRSDVGTFHTAKTVRTFWIDGVSNTRDLGGWKTEDGKNRVKYNVVFRGAKFDKITEEGRQAVRDLGIKTDIDLRSSGEGTNKPLGSEVNFVRACSSGAAMYYDYDDRTISDIDGSHVIGTVNAFKVYADPDNFPAYFHCSYGRDRTGTLAFMILGVLGVSREDIQKDYEMTYLSLYGGGGYSAYEYVTYLNNMIDWVQQTYAPEGTLKEAVEGYLLAAGVTADEIAAVRENLLEPVDDEPIATGIDVVAPSKLSYLEGKDELDLTDGQVKVIFSDGTTEEHDMTLDMVSGFDNTIVGKQIISVTYGEFSGTFDVEIVAKSLVGISITAGPNKIEYIEGEVFDPTGLEVTAYYNNDTDKVLSEDEYEISGFESSVGQKIVTVNVGDYKDSFTVNVAVNVMLGDFDGDEEITVADALAALRISVKLVPVTPEILTVGDINKDGNISVYDALKILRVAAKLVDVL